MAGEHIRPAMRIGVRGGPDFSFVTVETLFLILIAAKTHFSFPFPYLGLAKATMDQFLVLRETPNDRMLVDELELLLFVPLAFDQFADHPQPVGPMAPGDLAGLFDLVAGVAVGQTVQPLQYTHSLDPSMLEHRFRPAAGLRSDVAGLGQQPGRPTLDGGCLFAGDVP